MKKYKLFVLLLILTRATDSGMTSGLPQDNDPLKVLSTVQNPKEQQLNNTANTNNQMTGIIQSNWNVGIVLLIVVVADVCLVVIYHYYKVARQNKVPQRFISFLKQKLQIFQTRISPVLPQQKLQSPRKNQSINNQQIDCEKSSDLDELEERFFRAQNNPTALTGRGFQNSSDEQQIASTILINETAMKIVKYSLQRSVTRFELTDTKLLLPQYIEEKDKIDEVQCVQLNSNAQTIKQSEQKVKSQNFQADQLRKQVILAFMSKKAIQRKTPPLRFESKYEEQSSEKIQSNAYNIMEKYLQKNTTIVHMLDNVLGDQIIRKTTAKVLTSDDLIQHMSKRKQQIIQVLDMDSQAEPSISKFEESQDSIFSIIDDFLQKIKDQQSDDLGQFLVSFLKDKGLANEQINQIINNIDVDQNGIIDTDEIENYSKKINCQQHNLYESESLVEDFQKEDNLVVEDINEPVLLLSP